MIRQAKQEANYKNLGVRPSPKTVYRTRLCDEKKHPTKPLPPGCKKYKRVLWSHRPTAIIQASQNGHECQKTT